MNSGKSNSNCMSRLKELRLLKGKENNTLSSRLIADIIGGYFNRGDSSTTLRNIVVLQNGDKESIDILSRYFKRECESRSGMPILADCNFLYKIQEVKPSELLVIKDYKGEVNPEDYVDRIMYCIDLNQLIRLENRNRRLSYGFQLPS